ncbi:hypothetical protein J7E63_15470 [Bacillus sp. ISL-75]|uniref:hypothetical protein n=1 Tax=Bacillus sp. ISL-75 TaxID=2819137 RepID=UPI001BEABCB1|nr:hypothetical protein [Bacillus sp. ISL-75]MBT2728331.1 hypothetical protein [Bacillus sp. ISL-75]
MANEQLSNSTIFPLGQKVESNFIGDAYLQFVHLAITPGETDWFEPVDDEWFNEL